MTATEDRMREALQALWWPVEKDRREDAIREAAVVADQMVAEAVAEHGERVTHLKIEDHAITFRAEKS